MIEESKEGVEESKEGVTRLQEWVTRQEQDRLLAFTIKALEATGGDWLEGHHDDYGMWVYHRTFDEVHRAALGNHKWLSMTSTEKTNYHAFLTRVDPSLPVEEVSANVMNLIRHKNDDNTLLKKMFEITT